MCHMKVIFLTFLLQDVSYMANSLEKFYRSKVKQMPPVEFLLTADQLKKPQSSKKPQIMRKKVLPPGSATLEPPPYSTSNLNTVNNTTVASALADKKPPMQMTAAADNLASPVKSLQSSQPVAG